MVGLGSRLGPVRSREALAWLGCPSPSAAPQTLCCHSHVSAPQDRDQGAVVATVSPHPVRDLAVQFPEST